MKLVQNTGRERYFKSWFKDKRVFENIDRAGADVGGRATDISQLGFSIASSVKEFYPINGVPAHVLNKLNLLQNTLIEAENELDDFFGLLADVLERHNQ